MEQFHRFVAQGKSPRHERHLCKSIHGLKQSPKHGLSNLALQFRNLAQLTVRLTPWSYITDWLQDAFIRWCI